MHAEATIKIWRLGSTCSHFPYARIEAVCLFPMSDHNAAIAVHQVSYRLLMSFSAQIVWRLMCCHQLLGLFFLQCWWQLGHYITHACCLLIGQYPHDMIFLTFSFRCSQVTIIFLMDEYQVKVFHFDTQLEVQYWYDHHNQVQEVKNTLVDALSLFLKFLIDSVPWGSTLPASHYSTHSHSSRVCHHRKKGTTQAACWGCRW